MTQPSGFAEKNYTMVVLLIDTMLAYIIRFYIITRILLFFAQNYDLTITKFCDSYIALVCTFCNLSMPLKVLLEVAFTDGNSTFNRLIIWYRSAANPLLTSVDQSTVMQHHRGQWINKDDALEQFPTALIDLIKRIFIMVR